MATEESTGTGSVKDPLDDYDRQHGAPDNGQPKLSEDDAWGTRLNPVRETPLAGTGLKSVGG
jgi:hypothetical protein